MTAPLCSSCSLLQVTMNSPLDQDRDARVALIARGVLIDLELAADLGSAGVEALAEHARLGRIDAGVAVPHDDELAAGGDGHRRILLKARHVRLDGSRGVERDVVLVAPLEEDVPVVAARIRPDHHEVAGEVRGDARAVLVAGVVVDHELGGERRALLVEDASGHLARRARGPDQDHLSGLAHHGHVRIALVAGRDRVDRELGTLNRVLRFGGRRRQGRDTQNRRTEPRQTPHEIPLCVGETGRIMARRRGSGRGGPGFFYPP